MTFFTEYDPKPGPHFGLDWSAVTDNYEPGDPIGYGYTEQEAIDDLVERILEERMLDEGAREDAEERRYQERIGEER